MSKTLLTHYDMDNIVNEKAGDAGYDKRKQIYDKLKKERVEAIASTLMDIMNSMNDDEKHMLVEAILPDNKFVHPTLQQNLMREFILPLIKKWADIEASGRYDLRSEGTVKLARKIIDSCGDDMYLPHV